MATHVLRMSVLVLLILALTFLPFLPGRYDRFAVTLSIMAQLLGAVGLAFVPIAGLWLIHEIRKRARKPAAPSSTDPGYYLAMTALVVASLITAILSLSAASTLGLSLGVTLFALWAYVGSKAVVRVKRLKHAKLSSFNPAPIYLLVVPAVVAILQSLLVGPVLHVGRQRAIQNSARLIHDIEQYYTTTGRYPASLLAQTQDYDPGVIGIEKYHYELNGDAYDIFFEHLSNRLGTNEIVMYNKRDEHSLPGHDSDILLWTPEQLRARPGYYAVHDALTPHWKYFWFD